MNRFGDLANSGSNARYAEHMRWSVVLTAAQHAQLDAAAKAEYGV